MILLSLSMLSLACGARQVSDGEQGDIPGPGGVPEWSPCVGAEEVETCAEVCSAEGTTCVSNGCPAVAEFCDPEPCDMATQAAATDAAALCADPSVGRFVAAECDAPIDWLFTNALRCCCAED
jgi:hypothetical protein